MLGASAALVGIVAYKCAACNEDPENIYDFIKTGVNSTLAIPFTGIALMFADELRRGLYEVKNGKIIEKSLKSKISE